MALLLIIISTIFSICIGYPVFKITQNYLQVRKDGLPIILVPIPLITPIWFLTQKYFAPTFRFLNANLPSPLNRLFDWIHCSTALWNLDARYAKRVPFDLYCPAFYIVSPGDVQLIVCDTKAVEDAMSRIRDFPKSREMYAPFALFGENVDTVNGDDWARHRRITAPPFNERNSGMVWRESLRQAKGMLESFNEKGARGVIDTPIETTTLALHVLTAAALGKSYDFAAGVQAPSPGFTMSYRDALKLILSNLFGVIIIASLSTVPGSLLPESYKKIRVAIDEFKRYMVQMITEEKNSIERKDMATDNLMSALLRSAQFEADGNTRSALSDDEILGNLFFYNAAGHDTTANTLVYAIYSLSIEPEYQDWLSEEIRAVFGSRDKVEDWVYEQDFPKLKRCLALMYETLRHFGPVPSVPRYTDTFSPSLKIQNKTYTIPPKTYVILNAMALHTHPKYWGSDALKFRPDRFIKSRSGKIEDEEFEEPARGTFFPWATGGRACPGKKFAQVEFVAVIARLFLKHRVAPIPEPGETKEMTVKRVEQCMRDSRITITVNMKHPEKVRLAWKERS